MRRVYTHGFKIELDLSSQVLHLRIPSDIDWLDDRSAPLGRVEAEIEPKFPAGRAGVCMSAAALALKAKQFDDGLYAAVELAAERGAGRIGSKRDAIVALARALAAAPLYDEAGNVAEVLAAAANLGGSTAGWPPDLEPGVKSRIESFLNDDRRSKPLGFYTWNADLEAIFRQDRMLQTTLDGREGIRRLVTTLRQNRATRTTYENVLTLVSRLTNPFAEPDLRCLLGAGDESVVPAGGVCFFPTSRSRETDLVKKLYGNRSIPERFNLVEEMIRRIREGNLQLEPRSDSGWYDYQTWALEPLVIPEHMAEAAHLEFHPSYAQRLLELFKGVLALTRETHVKQLESPVSAMAMPETLTRVLVEPHLSVEPLPTFYSRRARAYRYVHGVLRDTFGDQVLDTMCRLTAAGPVVTALGTELLRMESLFYGAYATACGEIGMTATVSPPARSRGELKADAEHFQLWHHQMRDDPDLAADARMMVPLFFDVERRKTKVWVFLGWASGPLAVSFARVPEATVLDHSGRRVERGGPQIEFTNAEYHLAYPVSAEVYTERLLDRSEFRELCNRYRTRSAILNQLG